VCQQAHENPPTHTQTNTYTETQTDMAKPAYVGTDTAHAQAGKQASTKQGRMLTFDAHVAHHTARAPSTINFTPHAHLQHKPTCASCQAASTRAAHTLHMRMQTWAAREQPRPEAVRDAAAPPSNPGPGHRQTHEDRHR